MSCLQLHGTGRAGVATARHRVHRRCVALAWDDARLKVVRPLSVRSPQGTRSVIRPDPPSRAELERVNRFCTPALRNRGRGLSLCRSGHCWPGGPGLYCFDLGLPKGGLWSAVRPVRANRPGCFVLVMPMTRHHHHLANVSLNRVDSAPSTLRRVPADGRSIYGTMERLSRCIDCPKPVARIEGKSMIRGMDTISDCPFPNRLIIASLSSSSPARPACRMTEARTEGVRHETVRQDRAGQRLDNFLIGLLGGVPRSLVYRIVRTGQVRVNGSRAKPMKKLRAGDVVRVPPVRLESRQEPRLPAGLVDQVERCLIEQNDQFAVIDKPAGLAVHGGTGLDYGLMDAIRHKHPDRRPVHRLDRPTSGLLLLACNHRALRALQHSFMAR